MVCQSARRMTTVAGGARSEGRGQRRSVHGRNLLCASSPSTLRCRLLVLWLLPFSTVKSGTRRSATPRPSRHQRRMSRRRSSSRMKAAGGGSQVTGTRGLLRRRRREGATWTMSASGGAPNKFLNIPCASAPSCLPGRFPLFLFTNIHGLQRPHDKDSLVW